MINLLCSRRCSPRIKSCLSTSTGRVAWAGLFFCVIRSVSRQACQFSVDWRRAGGKKNGGLVINERLPISFQLRRDSDPFFPLPLLYGIPFLIATGGRGSLWLIIGLCAVFRIFFSVRMTEAWIIGLNCIKLIQMHSSNIFHKNIFLFMSEFFVIYEIGSASVSLDYCISWTYFNWIT